MIHKSGDRFSISEEEVWRPGSFETKVAAQAAQALTDEQIKELQFFVGDGVITLEMVENAV